MGCRVWSQVVAFEGTYRFAVFCAHLWPKKISRKETTVVFSHFDWDWSLYRCNDCVTYKYSMSWVLSVMLTCLLKLPCQSLSAKKLYSDCLRDVAFEHAHLEVRTQYVTALPAFNAAATPQIKFQFLLCYSQALERFTICFTMFLRGCLSIPTTTQSNKQTSLASRMPFMPRHRRRVSIYNTSSVSCDWVRDIGTNPIRNLSWPWPAASGIEMLLAA